MSGGGISVREVQVRRVRTDEVERWNALAREHHYLVFKEFCGNQLRHVAVQGEHWLALVGSQAAALHCGTRDRWIGWTPLQRRTRLLPRQAANRVERISPASTQAEIASTPTVR